MASCKDGQTGGGVDRRMDRKVGHQRCTDSTANDRGQKDGRMKR